MFSYLVSDFLNRLHSHFFPHFLQFIVPEPTSRLSNENGRSLRFGTCCHANRIISTGTYLHPSMRDIISTHCVDFLHHLTRVSFTSTTSLFWPSQAPPLPTPTGHLLHQMHAGMSQPDRLNR